MSWLVAVTLLSGPMPVLAEERSGFTVGIVEANGNLVPVATFDGSDWSSPWPLDLALDQNLPEWPDVPTEWHRGGGSLRDWTLWFENLGPSPSHDHYSLDWPSEMIPSNTALVANGFLISNMHCSQNFALSTNAPDLTALLLKGRSRCSEPKMGVATNSDNPPELVERLDLHSDLVHMIITHLTDTFDSLESEAVSVRSQEMGVTDGQLNEFGHWTDLKRRQELALSVKHAFRIQAHDASFYYFEIVRSYRNIERYKRSLCPGYSLLRIWVREAENGEFISIQDRLSILDCDWKTFTSDTPMVYWNQQDRVDLLVRRRAWESEYFAILTIENGILSERSEVFFRTYR